MEEISRGTIGTDEREVGQFQVEGQFQKASCEEGTTIQEEPTSGKRDNPRRGRQERLSESPVEGGVFLFEGGAFLHDHGMLLFKLGQRQLLRNRPPLNLEDNLPPSNVDRGCQKGSRLSER